MLIVHLKDFYQEDWLEVRFIWNFIFILRTSEEASQNVYWVHCSTVHRIQCISYDTLRCSQDKVASTRVYYEVQHFLCFQLRAVSIDYIYICYLETTDDTSQCLLFFLLAFQFHRSPSAHQFYANKLLLQSLYWIYFYHYVGVQIVMDNDKYTIISSKLIIPFAIFIFYLLRLLFINAHI